LNDESVFFGGGEQEWAPTGNGLSHCALNNENEYEDDDEYEEERCIKSYSYSSSSSSLDNSIFVIGYIVAKKFNGVI